MEYASDIDELIAKQLTGEMLPDEQLRLDQWLAASEANRLYFKQMQQLWQQSELGRQTLSKPLDVEAALSRTKAKIKPQSTPAKVVAMGNWRYAAAAAILLLLGAFWFFQQDSTTPPVLLAAQENMLRDTLSDGSVVALNRNSSLSATFSKQNRSIKMTGEAYFEVAPNPEKPFVIDVQEVQVTVVGTKFNIDNRSDPNWVIVSVEEGKVRVKSSRQTEYLVAGEQARIDTRTGQLERKQTTPSGNNSAWASRQFVFDDAPLAEVIPALEKAYNIKINLINKDLAQCRLHVRFNNESIERVVALIAETFSLELNQVDGQYFLNGPGCER